MRSSSVCSLLFTFGFVAGMMAVLKAELPVERVDIANSTFVKGITDEGVPLFWTLWDAVSLQLLPDGGPDGSSAVRVDRGNEPVRFESQIVPARDGGEYQAVARVRPAIGEGGTIPALYLNFYNSFGRRVSFEHSGRLGSVGEPDADGWITLFVAATAPLSNRTVSGRNEWGHKVSLMFYAPRRSAGGFDIADVQLEVDGGYAPLRGQERAEVACSDAEAVVIDSRRELFVDSFLIDSMTGSVEQRLHHPVPREIVYRLTEPWEGTNAAYWSVVENEDEGWVRLYYNAFGHGGSSQTLAVIESSDGIHFERPSVGLLDFNGSTDNNLLYRERASGHNFTPFKDTNPNALPEQRYKAIAYHVGEGNGIGAFASPDGIHWETLTPGLPIVAREHPVTGAKQGGFDSQNLAFWDPLREIYVCYYRGPDPRGRPRGIWRATSEDFVNWSDPEPIAYSDDRMEHMYTNTIRPYFRAPHIYIATPARFVPSRSKFPQLPTLVADRPSQGISDAILMSSRDGVTFDRWESGFIRPVAEPQVWTDRNNYPAWGMVQTADDELSIYWTEHYRHQGMRVRRGTLRTDGFVSLHAGARDAGEVLTKPFIFSGDRLEINYATSAMGAIWIELCDVDGNPYEGFSLSNSPMLFGNEIAHVFEWSGNADVSSLVGKPVRLRIRLHDADLYSFRFVDSGE